jgi:hypothetical protein
MKPSYAACSGSSAPTRKPTKKFQNPRCSIADDPAHPRVQSKLTIGVADFTNPDLKPWAEAIMRRANENALAGREVRVDRLNRLESVPAQYRMPLFSRSSLMARQQRKVIATPGRLNPDPRYSHYGRFTAHPKGRTRCREVATDVTTSYRATGNIPTTRHRRNFRAATASPGSGAAVRTG